MRTQPPLLAFLLVSAACGGDTEPPPPSPLTDELEAIRTEHGVPALAFAVGSATELIDQAATGTRHRDTDVRVTTGDRWHLGSDTKAMTATLLAMAVEEGRIAWSTTLAEALPAITDMHAAYRTVPIDALLAHRAGTWTTFAGHEAALSSIPESAPVATQRAMFADIMLGEAPELAPGTAFGYSNAGYMVAGAILERLYGMPWEALMTERLFTPLGMTSCGFGAPGSAAALDQPWGHDGDGHEPVPPGPFADNAPVLGPAGTAHCALDDWMAFGALQLGTHPELVSPASLTKLHTSLGDGYALGWGVGTHPQLGAFLAHDGSNTLWYARIVVALEEERILLVTSNAGSAAATAAVDAATDLLIETYLP
jgi:CubicO group peptidase (beta-lactamase class C family)